MDPKEIMRAYLRALEASPDYADAAVHNAFLPKIKAAIAELERRIAAGEVTGRLAEAQADLTMLRDIADQSTKHLNSLQARLKEYLRGASPAPAAEDEPARATAGFALPTWAVVATVAVLVLVIFRK